MAWPAVTCRGTLGGTRPAFAVDGGPDGDEAIQASAERAGPRQRVRLFRPVSRITVHQQWKLFVGYIRCPPDVPVPVGVRRTLQISKASASELDPEGEADTQTCSVRSIYRSIVPLDTCPAVPIVVRLFPEHTAPQLLLQERLVLFPYLPRRDTLYRPYDLARCVLRVGGKEQMYVVG